MPTLSKKKNDNRKDNYVQSILVSKFYDNSKAREIVRELGYNVEGFHDDGGDYYRFRQFNPGSVRTNPKYKTVESQKPGVLYVIEYDNMFTY